MSLLTLTAKQDHLEKAAITRDPIKAISEFIWNALDADALEVRIEFSVNSLGGLERIVVKDDGTGIKDTEADSEFGTLGASWKKATPRTGKFARPIHGKEGRGRLRFFSLAERARWVSHFDDVNGSRKMISLEIKASDMEHCFVSEPSESNSRQTGTTVTLENLRANFDELISSGAADQIANVFAPYLMQFTAVSIFYNGHKVNPLSNIAFAEDFKFPPIELGQKTISDLSMKVIEWSSPVGERKIHFGGEAGITLGSQPANVPAPGFDFSAYAYSDYFDEVANANLLEFDDLSDPTFKAVTDCIRETLTDYFRKRLSQRARGLIDELKSEGAYPYEGEPINEIERREREVFDIATHTVSSYSKDFTKAETSIKKMTLTLMREALRHNPDSLTTILQAVVKLPKARQDEFSALIQRTELGNIIAASSLIAERLTVLEVLRGIVFNAKYRNTVKERGELDALIKDNTWIFGEHFHITLPESGLTKIMNRVSEEIGSKKRHKAVKMANGKSGRVDCFLGRLLPNADPKKREYILIELKRPSLTVSRKEFDQVELYSQAIRNQLDFNGADTIWHFYLVASDIDSSMMSRVKQDNRPHGLWIEEGNQKIWVRTWGEIIRECEGRLSFIGEKLALGISDAEIDRRISELKKRVAKEDESIGDVDGKIMIEDDGLLDK